MPRRGPPQTPKNTLEQSRRISDRQTIAVTDLLSEGPIYGLVDGQASVFLNDDRAAPLSQAASPRSSTALRVTLTNGSTSATITNGGSNPLVVTANGKKYLIVRAGSGIQTVTASNSSAGTSDGAVVTTLTTTDGSNFFTDAMLSTAGATLESHVPFRLTRTSALNGVTDEGAGEGVLTTRTNGTTAEFTGGSAGPAGIWIPEGTYTAEVDTVIEIVSVSGVTLTLASAWAGTTGSYRFDVSGTIVDDSDVISQTQISAYEGVTTQLRVGTLSQAPFAGEGGEGSTAISNSGPSAGGTIEQSNNFSGSQSPKELIASSASGFNLSASQIQEVDEARVTIAYPGGFYAVSGKGNNKHTFIRYRFQIAIKKVGAGSFDTPITTSPSSHTVHSGLYTNATTFVETFDLNQYRPFSDFKIIIDRVDSHENPGFDGVGETFHDWQNVTAGSVTNTTCIIKDVLTHPYSAMAKVSFSTKQFQGMPERTYHLRGLKVQIPSNYVTREEAADGVANYNRDVSTGAITNTYQDWDGAFQLNKVYTNNPAWIFYDVLVNNRYGLGDFLKADDIDKYTLFRIARYCDELVPDGKGGEEPRFTANLYLTKQADAYKVLKDMATIFRSMLYFIDGKIFPVMDAPAGPVYNFSKGNVIDGKFNYEGTGSKTRVNQVIVSWINAEANYKAEPLIVEDRLNIVKQNKVITQNSVAMGAISEGQATRYGRWKLWTASNQKEIVSFSTALNASFLVPGDIINVQDADRQATRFSGRVSNTGTRTKSVIPLDSSVTINGSNTYTLSILFVSPAAFATSAVTVDGVGTFSKGDLITQAYIDSNGDGTYTLQNIDTLEKSANAKASANATDALILEFSDTTRVENRTVTNSAGATTSLTVSSDFSAIPATETLWALIETSDGATVNTSAKEYKILTISQDSKTNFEISAVEYYVEKFDSIDQDFTTYVADTVYPAVKVTDTVPPVQSVFASNQMTNIALGEILELHWIPPTNVGEVTGVYEHLAGFEISHPFIDRENPIRVMNPDTTFYGFKDLPIGTYKIAVKVINVLDNLSEPEIITVTVSDRFDEPIPRTQKGIPYTGDVNAGMQMSNAGSFSFKNSTYTFKHPSTRGKDIVGDSGQSNSFTQDCSGMVATTDTSLNNVAGEFRTDHYYLLLDSSESADKIKLLRYHKPNGVGTPYFYDSGNGSSTTRFGSALTGTFTKAANASKVIGSGTNFTGQIVQGDVLKLGTEEIEVSAVESNTVLYLAKATGTAHSGVQGFIPNIRIDYINDCIIARAFKKSSDNSFNFVSYAKTDGEVKNAPDVIADGSVDSAQIANDAIGAAQIADNAIGADQINVSLSDLSSGALAAGTTVASTPAAGDNSLKVATTQYADRAVSNLVDSAPSSLDTLNELAAALGDDANFSTTVTNSLASKAPLASPTFTGTVSGITKSMVGLSNVDNTSVADIRSGTTATNVGLGNVTNESKATMFSSPTFTGTVSGVSKAMVGLGNVDNNSTATIRAGVTASNVGLGNVTNESKATMFSSAALTGTPTTPTATTSTSTTQIASTAFVHAVASSEASGAVNNAAITLAAGNSGIAMDSDNVFTVNQSAPETITISHADTSSQSSSNNSGRTYIQDITLDTYGHVTGLATATETVTNTDTNTNQLTVFQVENSSSADQFSIAHGDGLEFVGSGATSVAFDSSNKRVTISSTDTNTDTNTNQLTVFQVENSSSADQFSIAHGDGLEFAGSGGTSVAFDSSNKRVTISSTDNQGVTSVATGTGLTGGTITGSGTIEHADTNSTTSPAGFSNVDALATSGKVKLLAGLSHDTFGHITGSNGLELDFTGTVVESSSGVVDIVASTITTTNLNAAFANFGTLAADVATVTDLTATNINTDFLNADKILTRDIKVGPSQSGAATISGSAVAASAMAAGKTFLITTDGISNNVWSGLADTPTDTTAVGYVQYDVGSIIKIVNADNTISGGAGIELSGEGAHLDSSGNLLLGKVSTGKFIHYNQSQGELILNTDVYNGVRLIKTRGIGVGISSNTTPQLRCTLVGSGADGEGFGNTSIGDDAGAFIGTNNTTTPSGGAGGENTSIGFQAGYSITDGKQNIMVGALAGRARGGTSANKTGSKNIGIGSNAQTNSQSQGSTLSDLTSGSGNIAIGSQSGYQLTTANGSIFMGNLSGGNTTTGSSNICLLSQGGTTGTNNIFITGGGSMTTGSKNTIIGAFNGNENSLDIRTSSNNIVLSDGDSNVRLYINSSGAIQFNQAYTFPTTDGSANQVLQTDGSGALTFATITDTNTQNQYAISCVDGDNSDEEKIRLSGSGHNGNTTDDIVLEAGTGLSIARSGDKITFANTVSAVDLSDISTAVKIERDMSSNIGIELKQVGLATANMIGFKSANNATLGGIVSSTLTTSTTYGTSSDYRLKTDVQDMSSATARLLALKPRNFKWIAGDTRSDGFIAHEVSEVVPEAVVGEKDGTEIQLIDQSKLIPILVKTIQELEARIAVLEGS